MPLYFSAKVKATLTAHLGTNKAVPIGTHSSRILNSFNKTIDFPNYKTGNLLKRCLLVYYKDVFHEKFTLGHDYYLRINNLLIIRLIWQKLVPPLSFPQLANLK